MTGGSTERSPKKEADKKELQKRLDAMERADEIEHKALDKQQQEAQQQQKEASQKAARADEVLKEQQVREQISKEKQKKNSEEALSKHRRHQHAELQGKKKVRQMQQVATRAERQLDAMRRDQTLRRDKEAAWKASYREKTAELVSKASSVEEATRIAQARVKDRELKVFAADPRSH